MSAALKPDTRLEEHLEEALETAENAETRYHLREALQKLQAQRW